MCNCEGNGFGPRCLRAAICDDGGGPSRRAWREMEEEGRRAAFRDGSEGACCCCPASFLRFLRAGGGGRGRTVRPRIDVGGGVLCPGSTLESRFAGRPQLLLLVVRGVSLKGMLRKNKAGLLNHTPGMQTWKNKSALS